jgi:hypothetical protein
MRANENQTPWVCLDVLTFCVGIDSIIQRSMLKQKKHMRAKARKEKLITRGSK